MEIKNSKLVEMLNQALKLEQAARSQSVTQMNFKEVETIIGQLQELVDEKKKPDQQNKM